jgi:hypothetical protein
MNFSIRAFSGFPLGMNKKNRKCLAQQKINTGMAVFAWSYEYSV